MGMLLLRKISSKVDGSDASGIITDTPAGTFSGTDTFTYAISDGRGGTAYRSRRVKDRAGSKNRLDSGGTIPYDSKIFFDCVVSPLGGATV